MPFVPFPQPESMDPESCELKVFIDDSPVKPVFGILHADVGLQKDIPDAVSVRPLLFLVID